MNGRSSWSPVASVQQPMSRFIQYHQKLFNSTRICTCTAQSAEGLTHARQELQRLSAILVVMVLLHKPELNNYGVSSYSIVVQLRFMEEDHNHQNGIQSCVLPVNQTWKCRFLGKQDQGMPTHVFPNVLSFSLPAYAGLSILKHKVLLLHAWYACVGMPQQHLLMQRTPAWSALNQSTMLCVLAAGVVHWGKFYVPMPALDGEHQDLRQHLRANRVYPT